MKLWSDTPASTYESDLLEFRRRREVELLGDQSWFTLAGLFWLKRGENRFGSAADNDITLPSHSAPPHAGVFVYDGTRVRVEALPGVALTSRGGPVVQMEMRPRGVTAPDEVVLGELTMLVLQSGDRHAIRLYDRQHAARRHFAGLRWYPIQMEYCLEAMYTPHAAPQRLAIVNVVGDAISGVSPGMVSFVLRGQSYCLVAEQRGESLFFNFRDGTNGKTTYGGGRFLYASLPDNGVEQPGRLVVDFNRATNPYCGYTPYAICPVPPAENTLPIAIEAGEMAYPGRG
jgi:uncharacterized protein (DUF1684 family)